MIHQIQNNERDYKHRKVENGDTFKCKCGKVLGDKIYKDGVALNSWKFDNNQWYYLIYDENAQLKTQWLLIGKTLRTKCLGAFIFR
jgi:glucan-binding YG repeat protein